MGDQGVWVWIGCVASQSLCDWVWSLGAGQSRRTVGKVALGRAGRGRRARAQASHVALTGQLRTRKLGAGPLKPGCFVIAPGP